ncbi:hypothetical protein [Chitinophaga pinensis]|uniref:SH3 domain-containing protein n=1 Tax=Chitinophaga pinensis TaxID=79329 RepID=A0A5C6LKT3_9BACT|nr:hypothetical protein [Chitinophaga pinensis]TWV96281.1 hypothetical protein FEF09_23195 [Chitinophaga pinensis]
MKQIFLSMLLLAAAPVTAQLKGSIEYNLWRAQQGDTLTVFAEKAYIRQSASPKATIQDSLTTGQTIIAAKLIETEFTMKGITAPWYQVKYKIDGKQKEGFVWLGLMAFGSYQKDSVQFLYGIDKVVPAEIKEADPKYVILVKALNAKHALLDKKSVTVDGGSFAITADAKLLGGMGLDKISTIVRLYFSGESCGIPDNYIYYGWNGSKLLELPGKTNMFDAGAVGHSETLLFPKEPGGQAGKIIRLTVDEEFGEDGETVAKSKSTREVYIWNGEKATKQ